MGAAVTVRVMLLHFCNYKLVAGVFSLNEANIRKHGLRFQVAQQIVV